MAAKYTPSSGGLLCYNTPNMKLIKLTTGQLASVDDCDYEELSKYKWRWSRGYAKRNEKSPNDRKMIAMHRVICGTPDGMETDHIDGNKLNNTRSNLRICSHMENMRNRGRQKNNTTGFKGVYFQKSKNRFVAQINIGGKPKYLGSFQSAEEAAKAYAIAVSTHHGEFARKDFL